MNNCTQTNKKKIILAGMLLFGMVAITACSSKGTEDGVQTARDAKFEELTYHRALKAEEVRQNHEIEIKHDTGTGKSIVINNEKNSLTVECGTDSVKIDEAGVHVNSSEGSVTVTNGHVHVDDGTNQTGIDESGIHVDGENGSVNIGADGIHIKDVYGTEVNVATPNIKISHAKGEDFSLSTFLSEELPEIISDAQKEAFSLDFHKMNSQLMEQTITVDGKTKNIKIYIRDGYLITKNCAENYTTIHGLTLVKTSEDKHGNIYRYYSNEEAE